MKSIVKTLRFSQNTLNEIRPLMEKLHITFTEFIIRAIRTYLREMKYSENVNKSFGAWKISGHEELSHGTNQYIRKMRKGRF